jgi:Sjoegren syndrome nuclear autoantigen 1
MNANGKVDKDQLAKQSRELKETLEKLRKKSEKLWKGILSDDELREALIKDISRVTERLKKVQKRIDQRIKAKKEYSKTIAETEGAYRKIVDSSTTMLEVLQYEARE